MDLTEKTKDELEKRIKKLEDYIEEKGLGSSYLSRAKKMQRNLNLALFFGAVTTVVGLATWALISSGEPEEE